MKRFIFFALFILCVIDGFSANQMLQNEEFKQQTVRGVVKDLITKRPIPYANVYLPDGTAGTVTNEEGLFTIKVKSSSDSITLEFSSLGYTTSRIAVREGGTSGEKLFKVFLKPTANLLSEVKVYGGDARDLVVSALSRVAENYPQSDNLLNLFYRETIKKGSRYVGISEGILDLYKSDYSVRRRTGDKVRVAKSRKLLNQRASDTLAVKIQGGPLLAVEFDVVKNPDALFDEHSIHYYSFSHKGYAMMDENLQHVVEFKPLYILDYALYEGVLYIDAESHTLTRAEISLDMSDRSKAERALLRKKPMGLRFKTLEASLIVSYRKRGECSSLDYIKSNIRFRCDWKRRLFSSSYSAVSEMVVVDLQEQPSADVQRNLSARERPFEKSQIFDDTAEQNWDRDFWKEYNIIEPTESLERAVEKLKRIYFAK